MAYSDAMWAEAKKKCRLNDEDIALAKDAGMNEHLAKPVDIRKMFRAMSRLRRDS